MIRHRTLHDSAGVVRSSDYAAFARLRRTFLPRIFLVKEFAAV
jgi:predicted trehalose synthase